MKLLWTDIETTGRDPSRHRVLEIVVATADLCDPFNIKFAYEALVWFPPRTDRARELGWSSTSLGIAEKYWESLDPYIVGMHTTNGLLDACSGGVKEHVIDDRLSELFPFVQVPEERYVLAGSSIHFDHSFIKVHFPRFAANLSHRHYDVSALKLYCQSLGMPKFKKAEAHRAKDDILESVAHAKECTEWLRNHFQQSL